mmetsp:Transcript_33963/g.60658  ORF Transcript_33963/g.60658 Transcript_33963/m.60658 type:complete len:531 (-) Transcript_33963:68-1660(-)
MYTLLAEKLWELDQQQQRSERGQNASACCSHCEGNVHNGVSPSGRPWGELPEGLLTALLSEVGGDVSSVRGVCRSWSTAASALSLSLSPRLLNVEALHACAPRLTSLTLSRATSNLTSVELSNLRTLPHLSSLTLSSCDLTDASLHDLLTPSHKDTNTFPSLATLDLSENPALTEAGLADSIPPILPRLSSLSLARCEQLGDDTLRVFAAAQCSWNLSRLDLSGCNEFGSSALAVLLGAVAKGGAHLTALLLSGCKQLDSSAVEAVVQLCPQLSELDLSHSINVPETAIIRLTALTAMVKLNLNLCSFVTDAALQALASAMPRLCSLSLAWCDGFGDSGVAALRALPRLASLNLTGCMGVGATGLKALAALPALNTLRLSHCKAVDAEGLVAVGEMLALRELSIAGLSGVSASELAALVGLPHLVELELGSCKGVDDSALAVISGLSSLQALALPRCPAITDVGLRALAPLSHLRRLDLRKCRRFTDAGLLSLFSAIPAIQVIQARECFQLRDKALLVEKAAIWNIDLVL